MNIYTRTLPTGFEHNGEVYRIRTDHVTWSKYEGLISDTDIAEDMRLGAVSSLIFFDKIPFFDSTVQRFVNWFYRCGEPVRDISQGRHIKSYSLDYDEGYIYAAFMGQYHIDLCKTELHWWQFQALFRGLKDCRFTDIAGYRTAEITSDTPKSRKEFILDMQELYELPESLTDIQRREKARAFLEGR